MKSIQINGFTQKNEAFIIQPKRLRTHGIVVGMTGSGKTGFSVTLLESLIAQDIPIIAIDPKGDLTNLALVFEEMNAANFSAWTPEGEDATDVAQRWRTGVEEIGISETDVSALRQKMNVQLFTPGRTTATPINLLAAPEMKGSVTAETKTDLIRSYVSGLFTLLDRDIDPINDPEHILLCSILEHLSIDELNFSVESLIPAVMNPPFEKIGFFPVETVCPEKKRMALAMALNNLLAAPTFEAWRTGPALSIDKLMDRSDGRVPVSIFTLAHLSESERHFFLSILLSQILAYTRTQKGSEDLEGLLFFDEVAGFLPPAPKNPVTKDPILTLMKQSRAVGFGVVLATQNPIDLDYKAISNAGLWCVGRLQTKQDRSRLLDGMGRPDLDETIQALAPREFLVQHPKFDGPEVISSRHAIAYLRGPITEQEFPKLAEQKLVSDFNINVETPIGQRKAADKEPQNEAVSNAKARGQSVKPIAPIDDIYLSQYKVYHPTSHEYFGVAPTNPASKRIYKPALLAEMACRFDDTRGDYVVNETHSYIMYPLEEDRWKRFEVNTEETLREAEYDWAYEDLPASLDEQKEVAKAGKALKAQLYAEASKTQFIHKKMKLRSLGDETKEVFTERVMNAYEACHLDKLTQLKERFSVKHKKLKDRLDVAVDKVETYEADLEDRKSERLMNVGETILGVFMGRRRSISGSMRSHNRVGKAEQRIEQAEDKRDAITEDIKALELELSTAIEDLEFEMLEEAKAIEEKEIRLEKSDIELKSLRLLWVPVSE